MLWRAAEGEEGYALKYARWTAVPGSEETVEQLMDAGYPYLISTVLASRGVADVEQAAVFLERERSLSHSPFLMKDMDRAVERINAAIARDEKIAVFGDYDVDGITATVLLVDYLRSRGRSEDTRLNSSHIATSRMPSSA